MECIYIPIWIDLKVCKRKCRSRNDKIYIPIWIDLKGLDCPHFLPDYTIYIPIWIDLKESLYGANLRDYRNLHSNMDRFERQ